MTDPKSDPRQDPAGKPRTIVETIEVAGAELVEKIKALVADGNVRRLRIRAGEGFAIEMPLTVGAIMGGVVTLAAPWLAVIGVIAAMVARVEVEIERDGPPPPGNPGGGGA
ncbi:MAG: DUF4342 domain-containing protein [Gemmobacter sp.]